MDASNILLRRKSELAAQTQTQGYPIRPDTIIEVKKELSNARMELMLIRSHHGKLM